jgi:hypothetical protein
VKIFGVEFKFNGFDVWHKGNFDPTTKINKSGDTGIGALSGKAFYSTGFATTNTGGTYVNQWTKLMVATITSQYADCDVLIDFIGIGSGATVVNRGRLFFRVKQQAALGQAPYVDLRLFDNIVIQANNFKAIIVQNDASATKVELWVQNTTSWDSIIYTPIIYNGNWTFLENQGYQTSLPAGTQISCNYDDLNVGRLISNVATGTAPLVVSSTTLVTNLNADKLDGNDASAFALASHTHTKSQITDMPTKLSEFINDIGAGSGVKITTSSTAPASPSPGDFWYQIL